MGQQLFASEIIKEIHEVHEAKRRGPRVREKLRIYAGHDANVAAILRGFGLGN